MLKEEVKTWIVSDAQRRVDHVMIPYDIWGTSAHVVMLAEEGIIQKSDALKLLTALSQISTEWKNGSFQIDPERGAQLSLEKRVLELAGEEAGLSMHTARSRNDQVMVTELLYLREKAISILELALATVGIFIEKSEKSTMIVMPGYTHMQPGKPTSLAHWYLSHADSLMRGATSLYQVLEQFDQCPLGAVESFGTSWPINRERTAELLGFSKVWQLPLDAISNRGLFQLKLLTAFEEISLSLGRCAVDLLQMSTFEYGYVDFGNDVAQRLHPITGSSVMAQKRNPDALELLRSLSPQIGGLSQLVFNLLSRLPSGYNRDSREVKEYIALGIEKIRAALEVMQTVVSSLAWNEERMKDAVQKNYSLTTDLADYLAQRHKIPYRKMYKVVGEVVNDLMREGKALTAITKQQLERSADKQGMKILFDDVDLQTVLNPQIALENRRHTGGSNSARMLELCVLRKHQATELTLKVSGFIERINKAKSDTRHAEERL